MAARALRVDIPQAPIVRLGIRGGEFAFCVALYHAYRISASRFRGRPLEVQDVLEVFPAVALAVRLPLRSSQRRLLDTARLRAAVVAGVIEVIDD